MASGYSKIMLTFHYIKILIGEIIVKDGKDKYAKTLDILRKPSSNITLESTGSSMLIVYTFTAFIKNPGFNASYMNVPGEN